MTNSYYIYGYYEPGAKKPFYIGKGKDNRYLCHLQESNLSENTYLAFRLRKMIAANIEPEIDILFYDLTEQEAFDLEINLINAYGRIDISTGCLYNTTNGGEGASGHSHTEETKQQMSDSRIGRIISEETKRKISESNAGNCAGLGVIHSIDSLINRLNSRRRSKNVKHTEECKKRMSQIQRKINGIPICSFNLMTKEIIKVYPCIESVKNDGYNRSSVRNVLRGTKKQVYGLGWRQLTSNEIEIYFPDF